MKTFTVTFLCLALIYLISMSSAHPREKRSSYDLQEQVLDYLLAAKREMLLNKLRDAYENSIDRRKEYSFDETRFMDSDNYQRTNVRRKGVGLSDNPF